MNILSIENISKTFGDKTVLDDVSFGIDVGDKIGIIGINGTGKTTLLRIIAGVEDGDTGQVIRQNNLKFSLLSQDPDMDKEQTIISYVVDNNENDMTLVSTAKAMLNRLGIDNQTDVIRHLSGGQRKRVALAKTLIQPADVLVLDEPTNHIDNEMAAYLENYLKSYTGTLIMVTHDRYFLDNVSNRIIEIDHEKIYSYPGNYSQFLERKAQREEIEQASERKRQSIMRIENAWAIRGVRARGTKQRARLERLEAMKNASGPLDRQNVEMDSIESRMGKKTIECIDVTKKYDDKLLIDDFNYTFLKDARIGIIGPNGCGKSTLVKMISGVIKPDSGKIEIGETIKIGYFSQDQDELDDNQRVIDAIKDIAEYVPTKDGSISASKILERFLFTDTMQYSLICKLSGGEKKRLSLLKVIVSSPNVLILDEITNDLDIPTLIILEDFLDLFQGIVITVSHDRYFLDNVVTRILSFEGDGRIFQYMGNYQDYLESINARVEVVSGIKDNPSDAHESSSKKDWKKDAPKKLKFTYNEKKEYETIDDDIAELEAKIASLEEEIEANASVYGKLAQLSAEKEKAEKELDDKMERWVYLNDLAVEIQEQ
ncbi:MAG: ABC-F family ATP-binding cassette domain-containing protein [Suipraeoptans sp.]